MSRKLYGGGHVIVKESALDNLIELFTQALYFADRGEWPKNALRVKGQSKPVLKELGKDD